MFGSVRNILTPIGSVRIISVLIGLVCSRFPSTMFRIYLGVVIPSWCTTLVQYSSVRVCPVWFDFVYSHVWFPDCSRANAEIFKASILQRTLYTYSSNDQRSKNIDTEVNRNEEWLLQKPQWWGKETCIHDIHESLIWPLTVRTPPPPRAWIQCGRPKLPR